MSINGLWKKKRIWVIPVYGFFYMAAFVFLENNSSAKLHMIHSVIDDQIPFCEYFIIPYLMWFLYITCVICYFAFGKRSSKEYYQLLVSLGTGMTVFIITCFVYPNGQALRPELTGDGIFIKLVEMLYHMDTPTNVLPSMHVFCSSACWLALYEHTRGRIEKQKDNRKLKQQKAGLAGAGVLTAAIILSTVFLKQHSVIDVASAVLLNIICYQLYYKIIPLRYKKRVLSGEREDSVSYF